MNATLALSSPWLTPSASLFAAAELSNAAMPKSVGASVDAPDDTQAVYEEYLQTTSQRALSELLEVHAAPLIQVILRQKIRVSVAPAELREIEQQIQCKLLARLRSTEEQPLRDFAAYVAVVSYNACAEWQRARQPQRHALKNRLRYLLSHTEGLALWETQPRVWVAGQAQWQNRAGYFPTEIARTAQVEACADALPHTASLRALAAAVFAKIGQPVELDDLVNLLAERLNVKDAVTTEQDLNTLADHRPAADTSYERRAYLQKLWAEIIQLPVPQRQALLLNLRDPDGGNQLALFHLTGIASLNQLAETLELAVEEFVTLWHKLPLDDLGLAARLGVTRQQIINLRLAARRRLARRMGEA